MTNLPLDYIYQGLRGFYLDLHMESITAGKSYLSNIGDLCMLRAA